jgi:hypothetical protein
VRVAQHLERRQHRTSRAHVALVPRVFGRRHALVVRDEAEQPIDLRRRRRRRRGGLQRLDRGDDSRGRERAQPIDPAEVLLLHEPPIDRVDVLGRQRLSAVPEPEMRAPQQLDERAPRKAGRHGGKQQIDGRGKRFGRERQRVERLVGHVGVGKHLPREVQIRQRALKHHGNTREIAVPAHRFHRKPRNGDELLFAIAADERTRRAVRRLMRIRVGHEQRRQRVAGRRQPRVFDPRHETVVQPLVISRVEQRVGRDDVDRLQAGHPRQQIEIGRPQSVRVRRLVGDRDDHVAEERRRG